jgi:purine-nucleoside phosphorylase
MTDAITYELVEEASSYLRARVRYQPRVGLILGSGLSTLADRVADPDIIPYHDIPHFVVSTVPGHAGRLVLGPLGSLTTVMMQGRVHYYEGHSAAEMTFPVRVMRALGAEVLIVTNAAGGIRPGFRAGDLMAIVDHVNLPGLAGHSPLRGPNDDRLGPRFPDMSPAYDLELLDLLRAEARAQRLTLHEGVYAMVAGPSFETPAEIRYLRAIGADAVGMSTAPEVVVARHNGMRVMGLSLITNIAADTVQRGRQEETTHAQVLAAGERAVPMLVRLVEGVLRRLASIAQVSAAC